MRSLFSFWCFSLTNPPVQLGVSKKVLAKERISCITGVEVWQPQQEIQEIHAKKLATQL